MKKKLIVTLCLALCIALSAFVVTASADTNNFDGETNLATTADLWNESWWTNEMNYATIDQNGILFSEYGTSSAVAAVSLKQGLPYSGKVSITFNSETTVGGGFMKVIFADASGNANGNAMKPWEVANTAEHLAVEIQANSVALWQYNIDNEYADGHAKGIGVQNATANYIDGNDHVLTIEYATSATAYDLKLSVDETVHYEGEIATSKLYCENVLTIGGYANSTVEDNLLIKSVKVLKTNESSAPAPVIDEDNLLGTADAWTVLENEAVVYDATTATATVTGCAEEKALVLKNALPSEGKVTVKVQYNLPEGDATHNPVGKIIILDNGDKNVLLSLDDDGNIWLHYNNVAEAKTITSVGDWAPNLLNGKNDVVITITPELTDGDSDVYVSVTAGGKTIGLAVDDLGLVSGNNLVLTGGKVGSVTYSSVKVEDFVVEMPETALVEENLIANKENWGYVSSTIGTDNIKLGGSDYLTYNAKLPVNSTVEFTVNATSEANAWYYLGFGNFKSSLWDGEACAEGQARFRITTSGSQASGHYIVDLNGTAVSKKSADLTVLFDGTNQTFKFVTETVEDGLKVTMFRNDVEEFSNVYAKDTAMGSSKEFYLMFRATGAHTADPVLTNVKCSYVGNVDVTAYNEAIATKRAIYALNANVTEENVTEVKAAAEALIAKLSGYTTDQLEVANNKLYAQYVVGKAEAVLVVMADKAVAAEYDETLNALDAFATITAENVEAAKTAVADAKTAYEALTDAQKAFVQNYGKVETVEIAIDEYELSLPGDSGEESTQPSESTEEPAPSSGCLASAGVASVLAIAVIAMGAVALKKKED